MPSDCVVILGAHVWADGTSYEGEYKNGPKDPYNKDRKYALALEILIDSGKVYKYEALGYYDEEYGCVWNADADGVGELQRRQHVVVVLPEVVETGVKATVEQTEVDTHIGGLNGFPCLVF